MKDYLIYVVGVVTIILICIAAQVHEDNAKIRQEEIRSKERIEILKITGTLPKEQP